MHSSLQNLIDELKIFDSSITCRNCTEKELEQEINKNKNNKIFDIFDLKINYIYEKYEKSRPIIRNHLERLKIEYDSKSKNNSVNAGFIKNTLPRLITRVLPILSLAFGIPDVKLNNINVDEITNHLSELHDIIKEKEKEMESSKSKDMSQHNLKLFRNVINSEEFNPIFTYIQEQAKLQSQVIRQALNL